MKKCRALMVALVSMIFLTGCMRFNTTVTVKSNGKLDVSMLYAMMDMSDYGYDEDSITESQMQEYKDQGWEVEEYNQDGFKGYILSKKDITANELGSSMEDTQSELSGEASSINFTKEGLKYTLDWQVFDREQGEQISAYKNYFTMSGGYMKITVNLPVKPSANNATYVSDDGKTLEWDLLNLGPDQNIHLEFVLINIWLIIGLCVFALAVIVVIVVVIVLSSKKRKMAQMQAGGYYQQPQGVAPTAYNPAQYQQPQYQQPNVPVMPQAPVQEMQQSPIQENNSSMQAATPNLVADELEKLKKLLDDGVITQEEFDAQKAKLLNR
jgi:PBP1b-binding outer membrane lipoprotein LpoB